MSFSFTNPDSRISSDVMITGHSENTISFRRLAMYGCSVMVDQIRAVVNNQYFVNNSAADDKDFLVYWLITSHIIR